MSRTVFAVQSPAMMQLLTLPTNWDLVEYIVDQVVDAVRYVSLSHTRRLKTAFLTNLAKSVVAKSGTDTPQLLVAITFISTTSSGLIAANRNWECEEILMAAFILANKYTCDSPLSLKHWAQCASVFRVQDLSRFEYALLKAMDYDLRVREECILQHYEGIMERCVRNPGCRPHLSQLNIDPTYAVPSIHTTYVKYRAPAMLPSPVSGIELWSSRRRFGRSPGTLSTPSNSPFIITPNSHTSSTSAPYLRQRVQDVCRALTTSEDSYAMIRDYNVLLPRIRSWDSYETPPLESLPSIKDLLPEYMHHLIPTLAETQTSFW